MYVHTHNSPQDALFRARLLQTLSSHDLHSHVLQDALFLRHQISIYSNYLLLMQTHPSLAASAPSPSSPTPSSPTPSSQSPPFSAVPHLPPSVELVARTHMLHPEAFATDMLSMFGRLIAPPLNYNDEGYTFTSKFERHTPVSPSSSIFTHPAWIDAHGKGWSIVPPHMNSRPDWFDFVPKLSSDLNTHILQWLDYGSVGRAACASRAWYKSCNNKYVWKGVYRAHLRLYPSPRPHVRTPHRCRGSAAGGWCRMATAFGTLQVQDRTHMGGASADGLAVPVPCGCEWAEQLERLVQDVRGEEIVEVDEEGFPVIQ